MNERIKKLAEQANIRFGRMAILDGDPKGMARYVTYSEFEKFAELFLEEVIDELKALRKTYDTHRDVEPEENACYIDAFLQAEVRLKEHFGVEE